VPKFHFNYWEEAKYRIEFEAKDLAEAKELYLDATENGDIDGLPEMSKEWLKGSESWDDSTLEECEDDK
jgi:hypothetical protein